MKKIYFIISVSVFVMAIFWSCGGVRVITPSDEIEVMNSKEFKERQRKAELDRQADRYKSKKSYREKIYQKSISNENTTVDFNSVDYNKLTENELSGQTLNKPNNLTNLKYRRSSLYTLMISDTTSDYYHINKYVFGSVRIPEKFNDHNIGPYEMIGNAGSQNQQQNIMDNLNENKMAKHMVARWFNRGTDGSFNMDLVAQRGEYNASDLDIKIALQTVRGKAILKDAGEELIGNTFVVVYDFEDIDNRRDFFNALKSDIKVKAYLYRLIWNDETASVFFNDYWMDKENVNTSRKKAFDNSDIFTLKYIGNVLVDESDRGGMLKSIIETRKALKKAEKEGDYSSLQKESFGGDGDALKDALTACLNKLQRKYEEFRIKFPLYSGDPIAAKVGKKEGIQEGDKFEVLEQILKDDGTTEYERKGIIKVEKEKDIWNNTWLDDWLGDEDSSGLEYTVFQGQKGKYSTGMLIRQIN